MAPLYEHLFETARFVNQRVDEPEGEAYGEFINRAVDDMQLVTLS